MEQSEKTLDMIVNLCKNRGYVFPGSEIYGGLANSWDYGPLGVEFKNNVKKAWLKKFVQESPYNVGLDAAIIMNPQTWVTTGHVSSFSDPLPGLAANLDGVVRENAACGTALVGNLAHALHDKLARGI